VLWSLDVHEITPIIPENGTAELGLGIVNLSRVCYGLGTIDSWLVGSKALLAMDDDVLSARLSV
jgi:hypothetical protein